MARNRSHTNKVQEAERQRGGDQSIGGFVVGTGTLVGDLWSDGRFVVRRFVVKRDWNFGRSGEPATTFLKISALRSRHNMNAFSASSK